MGLRLGGWSAQCNDDEVQVETVEECKIAQQSLGLLWNDNFPSANTREPSGCVWRKDGDLIFNTFPDGPTHKITDDHERQLVCVPEGTTQPANMQDRNKAAQILLMDCNCVSA